MNRISIGQAWSYATGFFAGQGANHAIVLIGLGIALPLALQFALGGGVAAFEPGAMATGGGAAALATMGAGAMLISLVNYILQTGSYFASWRIGLTNGGESLGSAVVYGLVAALPVLLLSAAILLIFGIFGFLLFGSAIISMASGQPPSESAVAGLGVMMLLLVPLFMLFTVWLAARFCCTGPAMADQRSYNILGALATSWRMTAASQWKIAAYFVLLGVALIVIATILAMIVGVSVFAAGTPGTGTMVSLIVGAVIVSIPLAYLQVGVPAGLYRALGGTNTSEVFA